MIFLRAYTMHCGQKPEEGVEAPGTAVIVVVHVGTGNPALALCKSSKCSSPLSHLSRPLCPHFKNIYLCYFYVSACVSLFIWHVCAVPTEIREGIDPLELEFQVM